jgi:cysteine desulfurase family protein
MIYLDNAATTYPKPESVYDAMDRANRELCVNAGRGSYKKAREASKLISDTKAMLRGLVHADMNVAVVFTPSITIALNEIIGGIKWQTNDVVYVSPYEHNAVARTLHLMTKNHGIVIKKIPLVDGGLDVDIEKMAYEFSKEKPKAVICTHISNVTGYILPIAKIFEEAKKYGAITVLDTAQSLGLVPVDIRTIRADIIAFAGHKTLYGPFGIGGFLNITGVSLEETIVGGTGSDSLNLNMPAGAEARYESSSTNINAIAGLNAALEVLNPLLLLEKEKELSNYLKKELEELSNIKIYLPKEEQDHVGIFSITVDEYLADDVGTILDEEFDLAVRTGYHCAPWIHEYLGDIQMKGTVRISLGQFNTREDIDKLIEALKTL